MTPGQATEEEAPSRDPPARAAKPEATTRTPPSPPDPPASLRTGPRPPPPRPSTPDPRPFFSSSCPWCPWCPCRPFCLTTGISPRRRGGHGEDQEESLTQRQQREQRKGRREEEPEPGLGEDKTRPPPSLPRWSQGLCTTLRGPPIPPLPRPPIDLVLDLDLPLSLDPSTALWPSPRPFGPPSARLFVTRDA